MLSLILHGFFLHIKSLIYLEFILDKTGIPPNLFPDSYPGNPTFTESIFSPQRSTDLFKSSSRVKRFVTCPSVKQLSLLRTQNPSEGTLPASGTLADWYLLQVNTKQHFLQEHLELTSTGLTVTIIIGTGAI